MSEIYDVIILGAGPAGLAAVRLPHLHHLQRQVQERRTADEVLSSNISFGK